MPLRWRDRQGMPRLAVFNIHNSLMGFDALFITKRGRWLSAANSNNHEYSRLWPDYPKVIERCFNDVRERLYQRSMQGYREGNSSVRTLKVKASVRFTGVIPPKTRKKIQEAQRDFDRHIYLVTEAPEWSFSEEEEEVRIQPRDPLVIGVEGETTWLIDAFDLTPLERAIKMEFTE